MARINMQGYQSVLFASLFLALFPLVRAGPRINGTLPFFDDSNAETVYALDNFPAGYEPATTEDEWKPFFRDNLQSDLLVYQKRIRKAGKKLSMRQLATQILKVFGTKELRSRCGVVVIRNNKVYTVTPSHGYSLMLKRIHRNLAVLADISAELDLDLPDTLFIHNAYDEPACHMAGGCVAPMFSMLKRFDRRGNKTIDDDILFPHMGHVFYRLMFYPWKRKDPRGLLRATMQNSMSLKATRVQLADLSASPEGAPFLDIGFVSNKKKGYDMPKELQKNYMAITSHAKYKFLVNANGHTASCRRGHIMQCNSVTLEEESPWIEYYWRSLVPYVHYLPYTTKTIVPLLKEYSDPGRDGELRAIANASQHFVAKYLTLEGKVRYAVRALQEYTKLFDGLSDFVRSYKGLNAKAATTLWKELEKRGIAGDDGFRKGSQPYRSARYPAGSFDLPDLVKSLKNI